MDDAAFATDARRVRRVRAEISVFKILEHRPVFSLWNLRLIMELRLELKKSAGISKEIPASLGETPEGDATPFASQE